MQAIDIAVIRGDGIGPELVDAALGVLDAALRRRAALLAHRGPGRARHRGRPADGGAPVTDAPRYTADPLVQGFPGKATVHGGLGWSGVTLLRGDGRTMLVDCGGFGVRAPLARALADHGVAPGDVTDVLLTHVHYDHAVNALLFGRAALWIGAADLEWACAREPGFDPVPELYARRARPPPAYAPHRRRRPRPARRRGVRRPRPHAGLPRLPRPGGRRHDAAVRGRRREEPRRAALGRGRHDDRPRGERGVGPARAGPVRRDARRACSCPGTTCRCARARTARPCPWASAPPASPRGSARRSPTRPRST